jgi:hypothetical protein
MGGHDFFCGCKRYLYLEITSIIMKKIYLNSCSWILILGFCACKTAYISTSRELIRDYALCSCIVYSLKGSSFNKTDISAAVYRDIANYASEDYNQIDSLIKNKVDFSTPLLIADYEGKT